MASRGIDEYFSSPIVEVTVSKDTQHATYYLHKELLCEVSGFFKACLQGPFLESSSHRVALTDDWPYAFGLFVRWAYTGDISPLPDNHAQRVIQYMIDVYELADKLMCEGLKNRAVDIAQTACGWTVLDFDTVTRAIRACPSGSMMLQFLLSQFAYETHRRKFRFFNYFATDVINGIVHISAREGTEFRRLLMSPNVIFKPSEDTGCRWHEHDATPDGPCERWSKHEPEFEID